ncbi:acylphosphatase [Microbacterium sp. AG1240]|uniref:acylphosphatase n=1 Tax=Microbacterium sp. AG1240 TaxID=2183992 RepID=UPI000EB29F33|nr:acylphosphatase [Microbacterium sp. AG1240]RKT33308.1 acylphosphatase [Microbacterium sp. AG1240]
MRRIHVVVRGLVQGVGYRYSTGRFARRAEVSGWVRNRADGSVEAEVEGSDEQVDAVLAWMAHGPPGARVDDLQVTDIPATGAGDFEIRDTV